MLFHVCNALANRKVLFAAVFVHYEVASRVFVARMCVYLQVREVFRLLLVPAVEFKQLADEFELLALDTIAVFLRVYNRACFALHFVSVCIGHAGQHVLLVGWSTLALSLRSMILVLLLLFLCFGIAFQLASLLRRAKLKVSSVCVPESLLFLIIRLFKDKRVTINRYAALAQSCKPR